jgi:hypothetical protein
MPTPVLYSTNTFLKFHIQERFRKCIHYVWCSESFDNAKLGAYSGASLIAPSSNPAEIYRQLKLDVERADRHSAKIIAQRASLNSLAVDWEANGDITVDEKNEIIYMAKNASFIEWRPLIYVIPRQTVAARLKLVAPDKRASLGLEYIIDDLQRDEFDIIEI